MSDRALPEAVTDFNHVALCMATDYVFASGVPGDLIEFGCYYGSTAEVLAKALAMMELHYQANEARHGIDQRKLWVFDSFEGFPEATYPEDAAAPHIQAGIWKAGEPKGGTLESVKALCTRFLSSDRVNIVAGWYKDTLSQISEQTKFALVHIDCDYYESTSQVLYYLFGSDMLSDGCTILFDDWWCNRGSPKYGEQRAWNEFVTKFGVSFSDWGSYGIQGKRFVIHKGI